MQQSREVSHVRRFWPHHGGKGAQANVLFDKLQEDQKNFQERINTHILELSKENESLRGAVRTLKQRQERVDTHITELWKENQSLKEELSDLKQCLERKKSAPLRREKI